MSRAIGVFGGTFDPVHVGHLDVASAAARALPLDRVVLMPAHVPPHRAAPRVSAAHRFAMCALAIVGRPTLVLSDLEMQSAQPSYTSATLDRLQAHGYERHELFLIAGADAFRDIGTWKDYPAILDRCHFVVISRPGHQAAGLRTALPELGPRMITAGDRIDRTPRIVLVDTPTSPVSSTEIRRRLDAGEAIEGMVPDLVAEYIRKHDLYGQS
jgi:nicotinate-nucleotide adenylyltransferase